MTNWHPAMPGESTLTLISIVIIFLPEVTAPAGASSGQSMSWPGCPDKCGDVPIPYPFGIGVHCAATNLNSYFNLICDNTTDPPRPMIGDPGEQDEIVDISLEHGEMRLLTPVSYICFESNNVLWSTVWYDLQNSPFLPSPLRNHFTVIGCNTLGLISGYKENAGRYKAGCYSYCEGVNSTSEGAACAGMGCCEAAIPNNLISLEIGFEMNQSNVWHFNPCFYAMVAEVGWYNFSQQDLISRFGFIDGRPNRRARTVADWAIRNSSCPEKGKDKPNDYACVSANSFCTAANNGPGYLCKCSGGYEGNPYLQNGCQDTDECALRKQDPKYEILHPCRNGICQNTPGSYLCNCKRGTKNDDTNYGCQSLHSITQQLVIGLSVSVSATVVIASACLLLMQFQRRSHKREKDEYFKQNGGLQLYDEMRSRQVDTIRILTEKEIKKATDNYNENRVIGCGGQGMVYKGTLDDQKEVAIKKSKIINDDCREGFVNEIIILSQINHRNIVRLIGCCLDVDVPMLVYEFVSRGTLSEFIHIVDSRSPIPLDLCLKIATQSAEALAYLHSSTFRTILHGDVKSANILLDDQLNAKVADFGASTLKSMDEDEFIMFVHGTLGYLDPESFISHCLTDKSDVYSFGVVLLELMTRKRAIYKDNFNEKQSLAYSFPLKFDQKNHQTMLDPEIIEDAGMGVLEKMAELAVHCLRPRGDDRPTMKEVAERLHMMTRLQSDRTGAHENNRPGRTLLSKSENNRPENYGRSSSVVAPFDETTHGTIDMSELVDDLAR